MFLYFFVRPIANYVYILLKVLKRDIIQFGLVFCAALFTFGGGFFFALRGEEIEVFNETTNKTEIESDLNVHPNETG